MNNKGQSLVTFVLILPAIGLFLVLLISVLGKQMSNNHNKNILRENIGYILKNNINESDKISDIIQANIDFEQLSIDIIDNQIELTIRIKNNDLINKEVVTYNYCGNYDTKKIENKKCK